MKKLIVISDWVDDTLTCQEFKSAVEGFLKEFHGNNISFIASSPSTIHTSFLIKQIAEIEERYGHPQETVIFENTDPRIQSTKAVENAKGADFIIIRLKSGIIICGPNAGYDFSLLKDQIDEVFLYPNLDKGSQFRSRDLYSRVCAHLMDTMEDELELEETQIDIIPDLKGYFVGHIDNYGNIKTTITLEDFKGKFEFGNTVKLRINETEKTAKYVNNLFGAEPGQLVIYPGSSGVRDNPYLEISVWRHFTERERTTGKHIFNDPLPGREIEIV